MPVNFYHVKYSNLHIIIFLMNMYCILMANEAYLRDLNVEKLTLKVEKKERKKL